MIDGVRALVFDVFGTVVDWRTSIIEECVKLGKTKGIEADWGLFADAWRGKYQPFMNKVRQRELPWTNLDSLHMVALEELLVEFGISNLDEAEKVELNRAWHRLRPWPDSVPGLTRLKQHFIIASLSNGNVALLTNMAKNAQLPWDCILSAELAKAYKPDPKVYEMAVQLLGLAPGQVMMVAAHQEDLQAAQQVGLRAAFIGRPFEHGQNSPPEVILDPSFDVVVGDMGELASEMIAHPQRKD